jgi:hypothetical protein
MRRGWHSSLDGARLAQGWRRKSRRERRDHQSAYGGVRLVDMAKIYTDKADRKRMSGQAMALLSEKRIHFSDNAECPTGPGGSVVSHRPRW